MKSLTKKHSKNINPKIRILLLFFTENLAVFSFFLICSCIMLSSYIPLKEIGTSITGGDAEQFTFFTAWQHHVYLSGNWDQLFQMPISHPLPNAGGLTDILPGLAFLSLIFRLFTNNIFLIYNLTVLLCTTLCGLSFYWLARDVKVSRPASLFGAFIFSFNGIFIWHAAGHLSVLSFFFAPLVFLFLRRYILEHKIRWALLCAVMLLFQGLCSSRLGIITLLGVIIFIPFFGVSPWKLNKNNGPDSKAKWWSLPLILTLLGVSCILITLVYMPALELKEILPDRRTAIDAAKHSLDPISILLPNMEKSHDISITGKVVSHAVKFKHTGEGRAFLGWITYTIIIIWAFSCRKKRNILKTMPWIGLGTLSVIMALGPCLRFNEKIYSIKLPWYYIGKIIPPLLTFRVPGRMALLTGLSLAVLSSIALTNLFSRNNNKNYKIWIIVLLCILIAGLELRPVDKFPHRFKFDFNNTISKYFSLIDIEGAVVHLPFNSNQEYLFYQLPGFRPCINSFGGGIINRWDMSVKEKLKNFPSNESINLLRKTGVRYIVAHNPKMQKKLDVHKDFKKIHFKIYKIKGKITSISEVRKQGLPFTLKIPFQSDDDSFYSSDSPPVITRCTFKNSGQKVTPYHMRETGQKNGNIQFTVNGFYPNLSLPWPDDVFTTRVFSISMLIRIKNSVHKIADSSLFWFYTSERKQQFNSTKIKFKVDRGWQIIRYPLENIPGWPPESSPVSIRIDIESPSMPGTIFEIEEIRFEGKKNTPVDK
jgi:hypothetical protein